MTLDRRLVLTVLAPGALIALWSLAAFGVLWATLDAAERSALAAAIAPRLALLLMAWLLLSLALGVLAHKAWQRFVLAPARLAEQARSCIAAAGDAPPVAAAEGSRATRALAAAINELVAQRSALRTDIERQVQQAAQAVEQERARLATLMAELTHSVVVCNLDGRVLLYNHRARLQFRALSGAPASGGAELIGLGRSIYAVLDRQLIAHALQGVQQRLERGAAHPSAQFVTATRGGQLLHVQLAPVRAVADAPGEDAAGGARLSGFVLMLDNITREHADDVERDRLLHALSEGSRASLGNLQAAVEMLDDPAMEAATRERFLGVIRDEVQAMSRRIHELAGRQAQASRTRWPLADMLGSELLAAAARHIESTLDCRVIVGEMAGEALWLKVDSYLLLQALASLATRLVEDHEVTQLRLRLAPAGSGERAHLDIVWTGHAMSTETAIGCETDPMRAGANTLPLSVRDVVERHGGEFWFERERVRNEAFFRFLLPRAGEVEPLDAASAAPGDSRPEFYDFDLFQASDGAELADRRLVDLSYTVFDTETTGLDPSAGDEIIQIGATRIVAGKLRRHECFEQLVDPQRSISAASIPIHGITPEMVAGQPTIADVLTVFHAFASDTVLVAHNAAFDMRFLQLKEQASGVAFHQPVLDTLLLSAVVHPQQDSHGLEAIAARFGLTVIGRHTALGDAMLTAEVFLHLIPLLAAMGIDTLAQAREAARKTRFARIDY